MVDRSAGEATAPRARAYAWTLNNPTPQEEEAIRQEEPTVRYLVAGKETGASGTVHFQGFFSLKNAATISAIKKKYTWAKRAHFEIARGSAAQNKTYCTKQDKTPIEYGDIPEGKGDGGASDNLNTLCEMVARGKHIKEVAEANMACFVRYHRGLDRLQQLYEKKRVGWAKVYWCSGTTGTGKSVWAKNWGGYPREQYFIKESSHWWDTYEGQAVVIFDDLRYFAGLFQKLLRIFDRDACTVEIKGGTRQLVSVAIIVTCPWTLDMFFKDEKEDLAQLHRRIKESGGEELSFPLVPTAVPEAALGMTRPAFVQHLEALTASKRIAEVSIRHARAQVPNEVVEVLPVESEPTPRDVRRQHDELERMTARAGVLCDVCKVQPHMPGFSICRQCHDAAAEMQARLKAREGEDEEQLRRNARICVRAEQIALANMRAMRATAKPGAITSASSSSSSSSSAPISAAQELDFDKECFECGEPSGKYSYCTACAAALGERLPASVTQETSQSETERMAWEEMERNLSRWRTKAAKIVRRIKEHKHSAPAEDSAAAASQRNTYRQLRTELARAMSAIHSLEIDLGLRRPMGSDEDEPEEEEVIDLAAVDEEGEEEALAVRRRKVPRNAFIDDEAEEADREE